MLKSISLENYKCFKEKTDIEIAPLTVLCGVNSSGKSSIIKSLLMLKQSYEGNSNLNSLSLNGKYTNNGMFNDISNDKNKPILIKNKFLLENSSYMTAQEKIALKDLNSIYKANGKLKYVEIFNTLEVQSQNRKNLAYGDNIIKRNIIEIFTKEYGRSKIELELIDDFKYDISVSGLPCVVHECVKLINTVCYFDGLKLVNLYYDKIIPYQKADYLLSNIFTISRIVSLQYKDINYLSPLRNAPERRYIIEQDVENVGIYGEFVPQILEKFKKKSARINKIPENDKFYSKYVPINEKVFDAVNLWLDYFGIERYCIQNENELLRLSIGGYSILDVGFGISQALPIITSCVTLPYKSTLLLEQPEVHLHPRMQMCMADLLIASAMAHKNVIIETHSDHIINRISRRMMQNEYIMKNSSIIFVDKNNNKNSFIEKIPVDPIKGIITDNEKFFMEFSDETQRILIAGFNNQKG